MKTLTFTPELCTQILAGTKTSTWHTYYGDNVGPETEVKLLQFVFTSAA